MNRRDLIKPITACTCTAMIGSAGVIAGWSSKEETAPSYSFTEQDISLLDEVEETILPRTDTPDTQEQKTILYSGMAKLDEAAKDRCGADFMDMGAEQRTEVIRALDAEAADGGMPHHFTMIMQLILFAFFCSQVGATQVLRCIAIPGRYDGCNRYEERGPAWSTS